MINKISLYQLSLIILVSILSFIYIYPDINISTHSNEYIPTPKEFADKKKIEKFIKKIEKSILK